MTEPDEKVRRLREEWMLAPFRAQLAMVRIASTVHTDRTIPRDHLESVLNELHDLDDELNERADAGDFSSRGRLVLGNDVAIYLNARRGAKRDFDLRLDEAQGRLKRGIAHLDVDDPDIWRLRVREAEARASLPSLRKQALDDLERLLLEAGYPDERNYRISIHAMNLAVKLRADDDDERAKRSLAIVEEEVAWRAERYSALHPFTLVARANHTLYSLTRLEYAADDNPVLSDEQVAQAHAVIESARQLHADRSLLLGERSASAVRALAYQARALRLCGEHEQSRAIATEAYALRGDDPETLRDDELPPILQICIASALQARREIALRNAQLARQRGEEETSRAELRRADDLTREIIERLDAADDVLGHQVPYRRWVERSKEIRAAAQRVGGGT
ncbi:hypothetical protein ACIQLJ_12005 [Microbacterium sp. NPDC091313]